MPPAGPFLCGQKGAKEPAGKGGFRFPPFPAPIPLKTTNQGGYGPPIGCTPRSCSIGGFPAAGAYSVTPPPHPRAATRAAPTDGMSRLFCILFNVKLQNSAQLPLFPGQSGFSGRAFFSH